jgi:hypothetical protein
MVGLEHLWRRFRSFAWPHDRRGWGSAVLLLILLAHALRYATWQVRDAHTWSDGYYTWLFSRSLAFDFDIDLRNDYAVCGDPYHLGVDEGGGRPTNPFYFGPALYMAPVLFVAKHVVRLVPAASESWRNGCTGPLVAFTGVASIVATALTIWVAYRVGRRWFSEASCAVAALIMGLASPLNIHGTLSWYYSHLWAALSVAVALLCAVRADERPAAFGRWVLAGAACGFAALMRMQEGLWLLVPLASIAATLSTTRREGPAAWWLALRRASLVTLGFFAIFSIQLYVYQRLYGSPFVIPQGKLYVQLSHAHPWLLLFGARSGFVYWTPLLWLPILGIPFLLRVQQRRWLATAMVVVSIVGFYVASSALSWTGSASLGARVQTSLVGALLVAAAAFLDAFIRWAARRRAAANVVMLLAFGPWIWITWYGAASGVPNDRPVPAPQLYGSGMTYGVAQMYDQIGNPWTLPAGAVFYARYRAPPKVFDALASDGIFQKHYRTLALTQTDTLSFARPPSTYWADGLGPVEGQQIGLGEHGHGRFLTTLYWPWVTSIRLKAHPLSSSAATLTLRTASFFRKFELGALRFSESQTLELKVPRGAFDSGINEVLLDTDAAIALESLQFVDDGAHDTSVRIFKK